MMDIAEFDVKEQGNSSHLTGRLRVPGQIIAAFRNIMGNPEEWIGVVLVFFTLSVAVLSIEHADWIRPQPSLMLVLALAVMVGWGFAKSRLQARLVYPLVIILGLGITFWQSLGNEDTSGAESVITVWWRTVNRGMPNQGTVYFAIFLILVTWVIGYISTWYFVRKQNAWVAVFTGVLTVLVNLSNLPREDHYFLVIYVIVALLLLGQTGMLKQGVWFRRVGINFRPGVIRMIAAVIIISVVTVTAAWVVPEPPLDGTALKLDNSGSEGQWFNIFADVNSKWSELDSDEQSVLSFSDSVSTSSRPRFVVSTDQPAYWRVMRYDTYLSWGWTGSEIVERETELINSVDDEEMANEELITYTVENILKTDLLLVRGEFVSANIPAIARIFSSGGLQNTGDGNVLEEDIINVVSPQTMKPYQSYTVTARVNTPTLEELAKADGDYPEAITTHYLQLPETLPLRVKMLSRQITADTETDYEKMMAILEYLNNYKYNLEAEVPPEGTDGVDYFLFESKEGICTAFSSAAAVMLRSVGIPARINSGYLEGVPDGDSGNYILRAQDYHSQPEAYFPGYGWVDFSAMPVRETTDEYAAEVDEDWYSAIEQEYYLDEDYYGGGGGYVGEGSPLRRGLQGPAVYVYFLIIGVPLLLYLAVKMGYGYWMVRLKRVDNPADVYARMCYLASLSRFGPRPEETPLEYSARLETLVPLQAQAISLITHTYVETRFGPRRELSRLQTGRMQKAWVQLCPVLLRRLVRLRKHSR